MKPFTEPVQKRRRIGAEGGEEEDGKDEADGHQQGDDVEDMEIMEMEYEPTDPGSPITADDAETENLEKDAAKDDIELVVVDSINDPELLCHPSGDIRTPMILKAPIMPTAKAVEEHFATHLPFRNWCPVCLKAKLREDGHYRKKPEEKNVDGNPIVSMDYQDLNETSGVSQKVLIGKDEDNGMVFGHYIKCKGLKDEWLLKQIVRDIQELGRSDIILKTDGEPAIVAVQNAVQAMRKASTVPRNPPAYNPQSNGPCEKAVQDVTAQMRAIVIGLEARLGVTLVEGSAVFQWALEHATFLLNHFNVGKDGMTPYERLTKRKWNRPLVEFGEMILAKMALQRQQRGKKKKQKRKMAWRCMECIWVGQIPRSGEHIVVKANGDAFKCRTIRRLPQEHRWNAERVLQIAGTPRNPAPSSKEPETLDSHVVDDGEADAGRHHRAERRDERANVEQQARPDSGAKIEIPSGRDGDRACRELRITHILLNKYGYTPECDGCDFKLAGSDSHRQHSTVCRQRIYAELMQDEVGAASIERVRQRFERKNVGEDEKTQEETANAPQAEPAEAGHVTPRFGTATDVEGHPPEGQYTDITDLVDKADEEVIGNVADPLQEFKNAFTGSESDGETDSEEGEQSGGDAGEPAQKRQRIRVVNTKHNMPLAVKAEGVTGIMDYPSDEANPPKHNFETAGGRQYLQLLEKLRKNQKGTTVKDIIEKLEQNDKKKMQTQTRQKEKTRHDGAADVAEIYSPPRVAKMAKRLGMKAGWSLDLTSRDELDNEPWDFNKPEKRARAREVLLRDKPFMLIASPMCTAFCRLQELFNYPKMEPNEVEQLVKEAVAHLRFALELCTTQHKAGRLFLFEHPASALSWHAQMLQAMACLDGVHRVSFDFCTLGMMTKTADGKAAPAKKRTTVLTNSDAVATFLREAQCRGDHRHQQLLGGRAGPCQVYTEKFCRLICEGVKRELSIIRWRNQFQEVLDISRPFGQLMPRADEGRRGRDSARRRDTHDQLG